MPSDLIPAAANRPVIRSCNSSAAFRLKASSRIRSGLTNPRDTAYAARATITDVFPEPAAASTCTRLSKHTTARACSSVSGVFSTESKNGRRRDELGFHHPLVRVRGQLLKVDPDERRSLKVRGADGGLRACFPDPLE